MGPGAQSLAPVIQIEGFVVDACNTSLGKSRNVVDDTLHHMRHRNPWPVVIGGLGTAIIAYAMYIQYDRAVEISGFVLLSLAALWDRRLRGAGGN